MGGDIQAATCLHICKGQRFNMGTLIPLVLEAPLPVPGCLEAALGGGLGVYVIGLKASGLKGCPF